MKKETLKEVGKGLITFGNSVGALSIINGLFTNFKTLPPSIVIIVILYVVLSSYVGGIILLEKGSTND